MTFKGSSKVVYTNACVVFDYFSLVNENTACPVLHPSVSIDHTDRLKTSRCHSSSPFCDSVSSFTPSSLSPSLLIPIPILHPDLLTSWPPPPPPPPIPPPLRPVMAPVSATPTPSPPPLWWATESCELHRETGEAASTLARWRASPDAPRSSRSVTSNCSCLTPFSLLHLILISLHSPSSDSPRWNRLLFFFNTLNSVGFVAEPGHRQKRWRR